VIVLDENFGRAQRDQLRRWRVRFRHIGTDVGRQGIADAQIVPLLHDLTHPTLLTWDRHFYDRDLRHPAYCIAFLDVRLSELARFARRFLRHPEFRSDAQRRGAVVHVGYEGIRAWRLRAETEERIGWVD
jgi:hypothetical protein